MDAKVIPCRAIAPSLREANPMETSILAKSSSGEPYNVWFTWEDGKLGVFCNCKAGEYNKFCKHKWELLSGNEEMLYDKNQSDELAKITKLVSKTDFESLYDKINELDKQFAFLRSEIRAEKKIADSRLQDGLSGNSEQIADWVSKADFENMYEEVNAIEKKIGTLKLRIKAEKKIVEVKLRDGF